MHIIHKSKNLRLAQAFTFFSDPAETRTLDPLIKSQLLYQLSYGVKKPRMEPGLQK